MPRILIVEDFDSLREVLSSVISHEGFETTAVASAEEALEVFNRAQFDCILCDYKLPGRTGLELLSSIRENSLKVPFIIMTAYGSIEIAVEAMKGGANDFITKPFEPEFLCSILKDVIKHRRILDRSMTTRAKRERNIMTQSPTLQALLQQAAKVAPVDTSVLILGESGTGKELLARYIHERSRRREQPFIGVNCAAMPAALLESEFFGYEAGAYTGATQMRKGVLEVASDGTIFLDEVGDMPPALQVKLLRALQEGEIRRLGSNKTIKVTPRIIAATNQDIDAALRSGSLREDFYYRLAVVSLTIPPLRERKEDIDLLTDYFIQFFCNSCSKGPLEVSHTARELLRNHSWPGNIRELENVVERAVIVATQTITPELFGLRFEPSLNALGEASRSLAEIASIAARNAEAEAIRQALCRSSGNKTKAATLLGVSYKTLLNKIKEYELATAGN